MGLKCYICRRYDSKKMSLFPIPNRNEEHSERWRLWLKLLEEKEENMNKIRICSEHFLKKKPAKKEDYLDTDWIPNQNLGRFSKNTKLIDYHLRTKKGVPSTSQEIENGINSMRTDDAGQQEVLHVNSSQAIRKDFEETILTSGDAGQQEVLFGVLPKDTENGVETGINSTMITDDAVQQEILDVNSSQAKVLEEAMITSNDAEQLEVLGVHLPQDIEKREKTVITGDNQQREISNKIVVVGRISNDFHGRTISQNNKSVILFNGNQSSLSSAKKRKIDIIQQKFFSPMEIQTELTSADIDTLFQYYKEAVEEREKLLLQISSVTIGYAFFKDVLRALAQSWSQYKHHVTMKYLIAISITGAIIFISQGFGGRTSDKEITLRSNILDKLEEGDLVLADKGFLIEDEVKEKNASLRIPAFVRNGNQLDPVEVEETRLLASVRIHVERLILVVRQKFNICSDLAPMVAISKHNDLFNNDLYDQMLFLCCCLVNMCPTVVRNEFEI